VKRGKTVEEDLDIIESAARNAAITVQRIQDFSRPSDGDAWHDVDPAIVAEDASDFIRTRVPEHVTFEVDLRPTPQIRGNGAELREVLLNLLGNALDSLEGKSGHVVLRCFSDDDLAVFEVEDTGYGMTAEVQRRVFEPFFTTKGEDGTGLGLSVSRGILRRHHADIQIDSEVGRGTRFRLTFAPAEAPAGPPRSIDTSAMAIVVDDDDDDDGAVAELMKDLLEELGHTVTLLASQADTLAHIADNRVDLLITDLDLPGTSGWPLARSARRVDPGVRVGLITGWPLGASDEELKSRGVDFVPSKPFSMDAPETTSSTRWYHRSPHSVRYWAASATKLCCRSTSAAAYSGESGATDWMASKACCTPMLVSTAARDSRKYEALWFTSKKPMCRHWLSSSPSLIARRRSNQSPACRRVNSGTSMVRPST
jgi:CheY-like chemotaxis protein